MKVKILKAVGFGPEEMHYPGDEADIDDDVAGVWIEAGYAEELNGGSEIGTEPAMGGHTEGDV